jgi:hypothetical protein
VYWTLKKLNVRVWVGLIWSSIGIRGPFYEHGNEFLDSVKVGMEFLSELRNC